ncbi:MerR family transcriptional regulator [Lactococcus lactis]|uniref:MerR family transcriptional regulator n=1 Tax=Lactococcus lactis TaxID=1358 RepID=UPI0024A96B42|nr:MerR family transcriptional regulator [Lactococcus lactis]
MVKTYKISEISNMTNMPIPTLRYYEEIGLLKPDRDSNNYRVFSQRDLDWITFIKRAKATGLSLSKIVQYSKLREKGESTVRERVAILEQQEQLLVIEQEKLQEHIDFLRNKKQSYSEFQNKF